MSAVTQPENAIQRLVGHGRRDTAGGNQSPSTAAENADAGRGDRRGPGSAAAESIDAAGSTQHVKKTDPKPTEWHRRPPKTKGPCPICGFHSKFRGLHRRVADSGAMFPRFVTRTKSNDGWRETTIDTTPKPSKPKRKRQVAAPVLEIEPTMWHRKPPNTKGNCPICGCPGERPGEHRRVDDPTAEVPRYVKRRKTNRGWKLTTIDRPAKSPRPAQARLSPDATEEETLITLCEASKLFADHPQIETVRRWCRRGVGGVRLESVNFGRSIYTSKAAVFRFADARNADRRPIKRPRLPTGPTKKTQGRIVAAMRMRVFQGKTLPEMAEALGMSLASLNDIRTSWPRLWKSAEEAAANEVIDLVRAQVGTDAILDDVDGYLRRATLADKWAKSRGESLFPATEKPTLASFYETFYVPVCLADAAYATKDTYEQVLKRWRLVTGDPPLSQITPEVLAKFRDCLARSRGIKAYQKMSPNSVGKVLRHIQAILNKAGPAGPKNRDAAGFLESVPWVRPPRAEPTSVKVVEPETLDAVYAAAVGMEKPWIGNIKPPAWWRALLVLSYNTGLRRGTIFRLRWKWLDREKQMFKIPGHSMKARRFHITPLNKTTLAHLRCIRRDEQDLVFPWPYGLRYFHPVWHKLLDLAGIPAEEHFGLHDLRKTLATRLWESSPQAAQLALGHTNSAVTINHYIQQTSIVAPAIEQLAQPSTFTEGVA